MPNILRTWGLALLLTIVVHLLFRVNAFDALLLLFLLSFGVDLVVSSFRLVMLAVGGKKSETLTIFFPPRLISLITALIFTKVIWILVMLPTHDNSVTGSSAKDFSSDLLERRNYLLKHVINKDFGPQNSPSFLTSAFKEEWAIGTLSMVGSALANLGMQHPELRNEHQHVLEKLVDRMLKPDIRKYEERYWGEDALSSLEGNNGHIGYLGHLNYLIGLYRKLGGGSKFEELNLKISEALARRILSCPFRFLETFPNQIFIPDNSVVIASLALYDRNHNERRFAQAVDAWLDYTKSKLLDPSTSILVPWVDSQGRPVGRPRGSYATWNVFYLLQADNEFALSQARLIKQHFLSKLPFGACGIREYLPGVIGLGDIDSGPVIFGLSTSGTGFGLATARLLDDSDMTSCLLKTAETVGSTVMSGDTKRYLFAPLIGDAIMLAMRTTQPSLSKLRLQPTWE